MVFLELCFSDDIKGGTPDENATIIKEILNAEKGPKRDIVLLNSAAAIYVAGKSKSMKDAVECAVESIDSGKAREKLEELCKISNT